jgi:hypothetical protein
MEPYGQSPWYLDQRPCGATFPVIRRDGPVTRWRIPPRPKAVPARRSACVRRSTPCSPVFRHAGVVSCCRNERKKSLLIHLPATAQYIRNFCLHSIRLRWLLFNQSLFEAHRRFSIFANGPSYGGTSLATLYLKPFNTPHRGDQREEGLVYETNNE